MTATRNVHDGDARLIPALDFFAARLANKTIFSPAALTQVFVGQVLFADKEAAAKRYQDQADSFWALGHIATKEDNAWKRKPESSIDS